MTSYRHVGRTLPRTSLDVRRAGGGLTLRQQERPVGVGGGGGWGERERGVRKGEREGGSREGGEVHLY